MTIIPPHNVYVFQGVVVVSESVPAQCIITPAAPFASSFRDKSSVSARTQTSVSDFHFSFQYPSDFPDQSYIRHIDVRDSAGVTRRFVGSSADSYTTDGPGRAAWRWGSGSDRVWAHADAGESFYFILTIDG